MVQFPTKLQMKIRQCAGILVASTAWMSPDVFGDSPNLSNCPTCVAFDNLATSGVPTWKNDAPGFEGWYIQSTSKFFDGDANGFKYAVGSGAESGVGVYSYGANSSDRGLGAITGGKTPATTPATIAFGKLLINDTSRAIDSITVKYTGEQWRSASVSPESLLFGYAVAPVAAGYLYSAAGVGGVAYLSPNVLSGSDASGDNKGLFWNNVPSGTFTSVNLSGSGAVYGSTDFSITLPSLNLPPSAAIMLRWVAPAGNTDGLGIDNVCISVNSVAPVPEPSTYAAIAAVALIAGLTALSHRKNRCGGQH